MKNVICHECGTENEPQYIYCKNCGARLNEEVKTQEKAQNVNSNFTHESDFNDNPQTGKDNFDGRRQQKNSSPVYDGFIVDTIDGVSSDDVATFVGTKAGKLLPQFSKMELSRSRVSWCWPPALLGFLFGPLGTAIWFLYRKMYKIAFILVAVGILYGGITAVLNGFVAANTGAFVNPFFEELPNELQTIYGPYFDFLKDIKIPDYTPVYEIMDDFICLASLIFGGLFSIYFYKKHVVKKINEYKLGNIDPRYYKLGLASVGGTSSGMAWLGVFIYILSDGMFDAIAFLVSNIVLR